MQTETEEFNWFISSHWYEYKYRRKCIFTKRTFKYILSLVIAIFVKWSYILFQLPFSPYHKSSSKIFDV